MAVLGFGGLDQVGNIITYVWYFILFIFGGLLMTGVALFAIIKASEKPVFLINLETKRIKRMAMRLKRNSSGTKTPYIAKIKKFLPQIEAKDYYTVKRKDALILLEDNNGLIHTVGLPNKEEYVKYMQDVKGLDLEAEHKQAQKLEELARKEINEKGFLDKAKGFFKGMAVAAELKTLQTIYLLPNPKETLEWLSEQAILLEKEYAPEWWKSPAFVWIGTIAVCAFTFIITLMVAKKL